MYLVLIILNNMETLDTNYGGWDILKQARIDYKNIII